MTLDRLLCEQYFQAKNKVNLITTKCYMLPNIVFFYFITRIKDLEKIKFSGEQNI